MHVEEVPPPAPGEGEVVIRVAACGVCGSDLEGYRGSPGMRARRVPPLLLGHEFSGVVEEGPAGWTDRAVAVNPLVPCGECSSCRAGKGHLCPRRSLVGLNRPGAFAERVAVPLGRLHPLPPGTPLHRGALAEPLAVALHALRLVGDDLKGRSVRVLGGGALGFLVAWRARQAGAEVEVVEVNPARRSLLASLGLPSRSDSQGEVEVVVDTVGSEGTRRSALEGLAPGGTAVLLGLHEDTHPFPFYPLVLGERRVQGSYAYTDQEFRQAVGEVSEVPEGFFLRMPLEKGPEAFEALASGALPVLKVLLEP